MFNPFKRITARDALKHEYFSDLPSPYLQVVPLYSASSFNPSVDIDQLTTILQIEKAIEEEIKRMRHTN